MDGDAGDKRRNRSERTNERCVVRPSEATTTAVAGRQAGHGGGGADGGVRTAASVRVAGV